MIVKFQNNFMAPGFGRSRFPKGIVHDVPDAMKDKLPKSAEIMPDHKSEEQSQKEADELAAADFARSAEEATDLAALEAAGLAGYEMEEVEEEIIAPPLPKQTKGKKK